MKIVIISPVVSVNVVMNIQQILHVKEYMWGYYIIRGRAGEQ